MPKEWPRGTFPTPTFHDRGFCTPGAPLTSSSKALKTRAAAAIQSWSRRAQRKGDIFAPSLPLHELLHSSFLPAEHAPPPGIDEHPYASFSVRLRSRPGDRALVVSIYPDRSVTILRSVDQHANPTSLFTFLPRPLILTSLLSTYGQPGRSLRVGLCGSNGTQLFFPRKGVLVPITGVDPASLDEEAKAFYAGILDHAISWSDTLDHPSVWCAQAPVGPDGGSIDEQQWYVPPCLPHWSFDHNLLTDLRQHLKDAHTIIQMALEDQCLGFVVTIQAGWRDHNGRFIAPKVTVQAISKATGHIDTRLQKRITIMVMDALRHPKSPVLLPDLLARDLYWTKVGKRRLAQIHPVTIYDGQHTEPEPAHRKMQAIAALGRNWTIF